MYHASPKPVIYTFLLLSSVSHPKSGVLKVCIQAKKCAQVCTVCTVCSANISASVAHGTSVPQAPGRPLNYHIGRDSSGELRLDCASLVWTVQALK